jgi:formylmethanofuran--tetrahydromethanopterin N-formyltransferase
MPELNGVSIADTFAEAFTMVGTRVLITARSYDWAKTAATQLTGFATSVIACDCEAGIERSLSADETPDGRPGVSVLMFGFTRDALAAAVVNRVGQCVLTCATTACYSGLDAAREAQFSVGGAIRYFGDGFQFSKKLGKKRYWRLPVMDGEFVCEDRFGTQKGVGGGNLLFCGRTRPPLSPPPKPPSVPFATSPTSCSRSPAASSGPAARSARATRNSRPARTTPTAPRSVHW